MRVILCKVETSKVNLAPCDKDNELRLQDNSFGDNYLLCPDCNVLVNNKTKHCKRCDHCIENFDHHCRILNKCISDKNYKCFFILLTVVTTELLVKIIAVTIMNLYYSFWDYNNPFKIMISSMSVGLLLMDVI